MNRWSGRAAQGWIFGLGCALMAGCAHPAESSPRTGDSASAAPAPGATRTAGSRTIHLEVVRGDGGVRAFVPARVAGQPLRLVLDTGALQSVLPAEFARAHRLKVRSNAGDQKIQDSNGTLATLPALPDVGVQFDDDPRTEQIEFVMTPAGSNDQAVLAPQDLLHKGSALVIDLGAGELHLEPEDVALERVRSAGVPVREVRFRRCLSEGLFTRAHRVTSVAVNGVRAEMLIDTGSSSTALLRNNPAIRSMRSMTGARAPNVGMASSGAALVVDGVPVEFGGVPFVLSAMVLPVANRSCWEGAVGADLLQHCTLVWGWSTLWAACRPQPPEDGDQAGAAGPGQPAGSVDGG